MMVEVVKDDAIASSITSSNTRIWGPVLDFEFCLCGDWFERVRVLVSRTPHPVIVVE